MSKQKVKRRFDRSRLGLCCNCFKIAPLEKHHIYPIRFFGKKSNKTILYICEECHKTIEIILPCHRKLEKEEYLEIHKKWLRKEPIKVI